MRETSLQLIRFCIPGEIPAVETKSIGLPADLPTWQAGAQLSKPARQPGLAKPHKIRTPETLNSLDYNWNNFCC
ncbi:MAG: hypothetical protein ABSF81_15985 [Bacteroidales bacterium]